MAIEIDKAFDEYVNENAGSVTNRPELMKTNVETARKYFESKGIDVDLYFPNFEENYKLAQKLGKLGKTKRYDMPRLKTEDLPTFQKRLKDGSIDVRPPFSDDTEKNVQFPEFLKGDAAKQFLERGLKDGSIKDDVVKFKKVKIEVKDLKPIQEQMYLDVITKSTLLGGSPENNMNFMTKETTLITSSDTFIIDGHHRYLYMLLADPKTKVDCLLIDLPIEILLKMALAYGDAIGHERNP